jgi:galactokinase
MTNQQQRVDAVFRERFGRPSVLAAAAPGRVNLIGEHVDYCGGFVLPMAIERETVIVAAPRPVAGGAPVARVHSTAFQETVELPLVPGEGPAAETPGWSRNVAGVIAGFLDRGAMIPSFDAVIDSTVPLGGGLSSSASLEVATATLLAALADHAISPLDLAVLCQRAEHDFAGVPCGVMDQCASVLAKHDHLLLLDCRSLDVVQVPFHRHDLLVLVTNSNVRHSLDDGGYAARRADCERAAAILGVASLREATLVQVEASRGELGDRGFRRARHVVTEIARTQAAATAITHGRWDEMGELMAESHRSLRDDFEVSCPELDLLVELAASERGVIGTRMTGGGFGGCTVTLVEAARAEAVMAAVTQRYRLETGRDCTMFTTRPAAGARLVTWMAFSTASE